ncbi:MAG: DMT family transporter [Alkalimonas sp.]|nr:DMT family transporter [Alkalimonas sp.]
MGAIAALTTACCWAVAARLYRQLGASFSPLALNFWKGLISLTILLPLSPAILDASSLSSAQLLLLLLSGAIGIGLGDTCFFLALNRIGDRLSLLVAETLAPLLTAIFAIIWLVELLSWQQWLGIGCILLAVDMVLRLQRRQQPQQLWSGYSFAALAALCQAIGAVISRDVFLHSTIDVASASSWRLLGGMAIIVPMLLLSRQRLLPRPHSKLRPWLILLAATLIGTTAAIYLQMLAFSYSKAAVVQTLLTTSVILSLLLAKLLGDKIPKGSLLWTLTALLGVGLLLG